MKKIKLILSAVLMMTAFGFIACSHSTSGANGSGGSTNTSGNGSGSNTSNTSNVTDGIRLQNGATKQVGDIILNDGTVLRDVTRISDADKSKAIAVIYKVTGSKAYGMGLVQSEPIPWCLKNTNGYRTIIQPIRCQLFINDRICSFIGDTDGSDNFEKFRETLIATGKTDDTEITGNYPAFEFANNYKNQLNSHVSGTEI
jgi:hypothetical protein